MHRNLVLDISFLSVEPRVETTDNLTAVPGCSEGEMSAVNYEEDLEQEDLEEDISNWAMDYSEQGLQSSDNGNQETGDY